MNQSNQRNLHTNRSTSNTPIYRSVNDVSSNETSTTEISTISTMSKNTKNQTSKQVLSFKSNSSMIRSNSTFNMKSKPMVVKRERKVQSAMPDIPISDSIEPEESIIIKPQQEKKVSYKKNEEIDFHNVYVAVSLLFILQRFLRSLRGTGRHRHQPAQTGRCR